jgi:hypothetical protein
MDPNRLTAVPAYVRHARIAEAARARAGDEMAGRTVWCVSGLATGLPAAQRLHDLLRRLEGDGVARSRRRLPPAAEEEDREQAIRDSDEVVGRSLAPDDVVVLHDIRAASLALPARERGAHVVWSDDAAWALLRRGQGDAIDAVLLSAPGRRAPRGYAEERATLAMPSDTTVTAIEIGPRPEDAWLQMLADIVRGDRLETVGGRRHARPTVAVR